MQISVMLLAKPLDSKGLPVVRVMHLRFTTADFARFFYKQSSLFIDICVASGVIFDSLFFSQWMS